jgi:pimeloyl-ACP methyl ester carboxylesterase
MAGDDDPIIPTANGRVMARLMPNAQLHIYQGGHVEIVSQAAVLAPVISDFLKQPESS